MSCDTLALQVPGEHQTISHPCIPQVNINQYLPYIQVRVVTEESVIRLEFTLILLAVSFCFVALNVPYFATWLKLFLTSQYISLSSFTRPTDLDYFRGVAFITRAVFYINYCINFFLYSITGAYFRRELRMLFLLRQQKYKYGSTHTRCTRLASGSTHSRQNSQLSPQSQPFQGGTSNRQHHPGSRQSCSHSTTTTTTTQSWV